jgi:hypothetical protein
MPGDRRWPAPLAWLRLPARDVDFIQLSRIRGATNGKVETSRGRKSPAQELYGALRECRRKRRNPSEARAPKLIIQEGKKGFGGLMSVFTEIEPVIDFRRDIDAEKAGKFPGIITGTN